LLLQATQPPTIPTPNTSKKSKLTHAQSLAFKEPTNNNQLEAEATNQLSSRALAAAGNQQAPQPGQRTIQLEADTAPHSTNKPARS